MMNLRLRGDNPNLGTNLTNLNMAPDTPAHLHLEPDAPKKKTTYAHARGPAPRRLGSVLGQERLL